MKIVEIRWRPSGGRGEYEHVPHDVLLNRQIVVASPSVAGAFVATDARGVIRDGKPRLRRDDPNDRSTLNVHQVIAALALLPDPIREDKGQVVLPLREKGYVISAITFQVDDSTPGVAVCYPLRLQVLRDASVIDVADRLEKISALLNSPGLPSGVREAGSRYERLVKSGHANSALRGVAREFRDQIFSDYRLSLLLDSPSFFVSGDSPLISLPVNIVPDISVDETKRRLRSHYRIDRSRKIRAAKIESFFQNNGSIFCENCTFDFSQKYGERGRGFIEVHHKLPLAYLMPNTVTFLEDLMLLCANCHRVVHRRQPILSPYELRAITKMDGGKDR